jgi:hypothetical protein
MGERQENCKRQKRFDELLQVNVARYCSVK